MESALEYQDKQTESPRKRRWLGAITAVLASVFALFFAEILVRLFFPFNTPDTVREHSLEYEPAVYARTLLKPVDRLVDLDSAKAWGSKAIDKPSDLSVFVSSNGYRGPAFEVRKPPQVTRIIVLGGSAVFDHGVSDHASAETGSWPHLLGQRLTEEGLKNVEVINAGIPGHSTSDSLGRLYAQLWMYDPDLVLIYHGWNDIKFWKALEITPERPLISHVKPYDPTSNPFTSYQGFWDKLLSNSQLYLKVRNKYYMLRTNVGLEGAVDGTVERATDYDDYGARQFHLNMELIVTASRIIGATPVMVTQATLVTPNNSSADRVRINYEYQNLEHDAIVRAYQSTYDIIRDIGSRTDTMVIDAASLLNGRSELFNDHVHLRPEGSKVLAAVVADELAPILRGDGVPEK